MKKKLLLTCITLSLVLSAVGCGKKNESTNSSTDTKADTTESSDIKDEDADDSEKTMTVDSLPTSAEEFQYYEISGKYVNSETNDECNISIYTDEIEDSNVGNVDFTYQGTNYQALLYQVSDNVFQFESEEGTTFWLGFNKTSNDFSFTLYENSVEKGNFKMVEHFES